MFPDLDLVGSFLGVWLAHTGFGLPLAIYLLRNFIGALPSSIIESARIDGADHFTIFWRLVVPLSVPALAAFAIFQFLWVWNDLLVAYVFLGGTDETSVLTVALRNLVGSTRGELAPPHGGRVHLDGAPADRVLRAAEVLRPGLDGRRGEGVIVAGRARRSTLAGLEPLSPRLKWRAILIATLALVPAYWTLLAGLVAVASGADDAPRGRSPDRLRPRRDPVRVRHARVLLRAPAVARSRRARRCCSRCSSGSPSRPWRPTR